MALTESNMLPLGTTAPDFYLYNVVSGTETGLQEVRGQKATVVMFICNHCPYVKHVNAGIAALAKDYRTRGVGFVAISSNDVEKYPEDSPEKMKQNAAQHHFPFPYLYDETQETARAYDAACTPDFYVFNNQLQLVYRGQLDDSRPGNGIPVTGKDIRNVLDALLENKTIPGRQKPSMGCNIKWKS